MNLPDEKAKRFVSVLNKKVEVGKLMNALGHTTAGMVSRVNDAEEMYVLRYEDADGGIHPNISHYGFIVLKADNSNKIRRVREQAIEKGMPFADFTNTMTIGSSLEQQKKTAQTKEEDLEYYCITLFGDTEDLREMTGRFSLFRPA